MSSLERPLVHARGSLHRPLLLALQRTVRLDRVEFESALLMQKTENIFSWWKETIKLVIGCLPMFASNIHEETSQPTLSS